ncbi:MAG: hypothetical protein EP340_04100 [Alphaproteobacteria bacterium]|nr:MAG: hypothetical protein EP340_04100 [Alphaproteobacteria bacterium]
MFNGIDALGVLGAGLIILTYFLLQIKRLEGTSLAYTGLNALGALLILISLLFNFNLASFIIEGFWLAISLFGIVMALRGR